MTSVKSSINIRNLKPQIQPKPSTSSSLNFGDDTLKSAKPLVISMPTIIKPTLSTGNRKPHLPFVLSEKTCNDESFEDNPPSPPMPKCPAPVLVINDNSADDDDEEKESYAITLYNFESDVTEDLNFKANEKVYLIKQMNEEWFYGRNKRGCEGIFPISFVEIRVPLNFHPETSS
jgi:SH3 domain-containing protein 19